MVFFGFEHTIIWYSADSLPTELLAPLLNFVKPCVVPYPLLASSKLSRKPDRRLMMYRQAMTIVMRD